MDYKAIETYYNGYRFRSRLEARWAVFFDSMKIRYLYENEGFERFFEDEGPSIKYLPDFYLPDYDLFAEVKGIRHRGQMTKEDAYKMSWMIDYDGPCKQGIIMLGNIPESKGADTMDWAVWLWTGKGLAWQYFMQDYPPHIETDQCVSDIRHPDSAPVEFDKNDDYVLTESVCFQWESDCGIPYRSKKTIVEKSLQAARAARFEHNETPIIGGY